MPNDSISNEMLASTACWMASVRARESQREDRLVDDPWAEILAGEVGAEWIAQRPPESTLPIVLRTRYFDDFLLKIAAQDSIRQLVLVAAGYDTRAYRLQWTEGTVIYELDQEAVLESKARILTDAGAHPTCDRRAIGVDLKLPWKDNLLRGGFDPGVVSGWLVEGLLFYLPGEHGAKILDEVCNLATSGSWLGFDAINNAMLASPITKPWIEMQARMGAPWVGTLDDPDEFLAERGWQASLTQAGQPDANHGRWTLPVFPVRMPDMPHNWFVTARKQ